jgi:hypothetical protein
LLLQLLYLYLYQLRKLPPFKSSAIFYAQKLLMIYIKTYFLLLFTVAVINCSAQSSTISYNDKLIQYEGRIAYRNGAAELSWPGTIARINFEGTGVSAILKDSDTSNYYNVIVDDTIITKIHTDTAKHSYLLASALPAGKHKLELFKCTEWDKGKTWLYGFELAPNTKALQPPPLKKRKIEFYGNSITCGYGTEDSSGNDSPYGYFENNYVSYAALTARHFDAQYSCIAKSGIGVMVSWFPLIMPEMYDRLAPTDATSKWNFSNYTPDVVVVNLFQNDSWIVNNPTNEQFKARFGNKKPDAPAIISAYKNFIATLRSKYANATIICALGNMDATKEGSPWPGYIEQAAKQLNDSKIYMHFFPYKNTPGHPKVNEQKAMAESLIAFIEKTVTW